MAAPSIATALRRSLLIKIISKPAPSKEDVASVIEEVKSSEFSERGETRADDRTSEAAMEDRKREGYF